MHWDQWLEFKTFCGLRGFEGWWKDGFILWIVKTKVHWFQCIYFQTEKCLLSVFMWTLLWSRLPRQKKTKKNKQQKTGSAYLKLECSNETVCNSEQSVHLVSNHFSADVQSSKIISSYFFFYFVLVCFRVSVLSFWWRFSEGVMLRGLSCL